MRFLEDHQDLAKLERQRLALALAVRGLPNGDYEARRLARMQLQLDFRIGRIQRARAEAEREKDAPRIADRRPLAVRVESARRALSGRSS